MLRRSLQNAEQKHFVNVFDETRKLFSTANGFISNMLRDSESHLNFTSTSDGMYGDFKYTVRRGENSYMKSSRVI